MQQESGGDMLRRMSTESSSIAQKLKVVLENIQAACEKRPQKLQYAAPQLVAVSKTKGLDMVMEAYDAGQRHFGENYVQELDEKGHDIELLDHCEDIKWHFIGRLQRNKVAKLLGVPNLYMIETVDNERLAKAVNDTWGRLNKPAPIKCMAQVNTSGEENKSGCTPDTAVELARYMRENCPHIDLAGLMTIGSFGHNPKAGINPDFEKLVQVREEVCKALNIPTEDLGLSMGMSADYEQA
ncbi:proline synthase co-transcribed bacterial homolog protein, partial [Elysia marginata]